MDFIDDYVSHFQNEVAIENGKPSQEDLRDMRDSIDNAIDDLEELRDSLDPRLTTDEEIVKTLKGYKMGWEE